MNGIATQHDLSRNEWLEAAALGALRMAVNDTQRARVRDRGHRVNILNDLIGAIGELTCLAYLEGLGATSINHNVLSLESFVDDVDFRFQLQGHRYSAEVKCELLETRKFRFLINDEALKRSKERGAQVFIPIISSVGAPFCYIGKSISIADIEAWRIESFQYGDPARSQRLAEVLPMYFGMAEPAVRQELEAAAGQSIATASLEDIFRARSGLLRLAAQERIQLADLSREALSANLAELISMARQ